MNINLYLENIIGLLWKLIYLVSSSKVISILSLWLRVGAYFIEQSVSHD